MGLILLIMVSLFRRIDWKKEVDPKTILWIIAIALSIYIIGFATILTTLQGV